MKNNRRQAQFLLRSITDDVPQLLLEENNLVFRNELKKDLNTHKPQVSEN
ncbi:hypothetical protein [Catenibacterium mitsuokai]|nr:hypothetical protein [Catenibacterium tridentinum]